MNLFVFSNNTEYSQFISTFVLGNRDAKPNSQQIIANFGCNAQLVRPLHLFLADPILDSSMFKILSTLPSICGQWIVKHQQQCVVQLNEIGHFSQTERTSTDKLELSGFSNK